jgi:hypothetical protein
VTDQSEDAAWIIVSDGLDADMDRLAGYCRALVNAWFETARGLAAGPTVDSPAAADAEQLRKAKPDAPVNIEHGAGQQAGLYVDAIAQHLLAIEALLRARRVGVSLWPLVRAQLEVAGRVAWLTDPRVGQRAGEVRVARLLLEMISSLQRERFTAGKYDKAHAKHAKRLRDEKIAEAGSLFNQVDLSLTSIEEFGSWTINGEGLPSLGGAANLFVGLHFSGQAKALYDLLSDYSHPSLVGIDRQTTIIEIDGVSTRPWTVGFDTVESQIRLACMVLYKAAHMIVGYYGLDESPLERWADEVPTTWFGLDMNEAGPPQ